MVLVDLQFEVSNANGKGNCSVWYPGESGSRLKLFWKYKIYSENSENSETENPDSQVSWSCLNPWRINYCNISY